MDNTKFIKNSENAKIRNISFEEKKIDDPTLIITSATNSSIVTIPYIMNVVHPIQMEGSFAQIEVLSHIIGQISHLLKYKCTKL